MPTVTLKISDTAFVSSAQPGNNFSFYPLMYAGTDSDLLNCIGLMKILFPKLPVNQVDRAVLQVTAIAKSGNVQSQIAVERVTSSFNISAVTYNTRPSFAATESAFSVSTADLYTKIHIDVTALVNSWLNGTLPNNGIALVNSDDATVVTFAANATGSESYSPELVLTYSGTPLESTALCFSYAQLANLMNQLIALYPAKTIHIYTKGFNAAAIVGTPVELYVSPDATYGMLAVLKDGGEYGIVPLNTITAISLSEDTVYNPSITYLPPPAFPAGCDKNLITAYHDYLWPSTSITIYAGTIIQMSGIVFKNEYGILVLADSLGENPVFVPVIHITAIVTTAPSDSTTGQTQSRLILSGKSFISLPKSQEKK